MARTGARFAREKQVPRCARNDSQKSKSKSKSNGKSEMRGSLHCAFAKSANVSVEMTVWWGVR
jgi:hypothetical protein